MQKSKLSPLLTLTVMVLEVEAVAVVEEIHDSERGCQQGNSQASQGCLEQGLVQRYGLGA